MPKSPRSRARSSRNVPPPIDPSAPGVVLVYVGGRTGRHVPARDLEGPDLARIAYHRAAARVRASRSGLRRPGEERPAPRRAEQPGLAEVLAVRDELLAGGHFIAPDAAPAAPDPVQQPDTPAEPEA